VQTRYVDILSANGVIGFAGGTQGVSLGTNTTVGYRATSSQTSDTGDIQILADKISLDETGNAPAINTSGIVTIAPATNTNQIEIGAADSAGVLGISVTELGNITAGTVRLGALGGSNSGNIVVSANINPSKFNKLALRTSGSVTQSSSYGITIANLGISAGGDITLAGANNTTTLALTTSKVASPVVTYAEATGQTYGVAQVDSISANFGIATQYSVANAPTIGYLNQNFNPAPVVTVKDLYGNVISAQNTVQNTVVASTSTVGFTLGGTKSITQSVGTFTFDALKVTAGTGSIVVNFAISAISGQASVNTASITIQAGDPDHLMVKVAASGGVAGLAFTTQPQIEIQTAANTVVTTAPGTTLVVTATMTSADGSLIGTATATASAGVATFTDLGIGGKSTGSYTISYSATFNTTNLTIDQTGISITAGAATKLILTTAAVGFVNQANFTTQPAVTAQDYYGNTVTSWATSVTVSSNVGGFVGTTTISFTNGVATYSGLAPSGVIGSRTITFTSGALATASQTFDLTFGAATKLAIKTSAAGFVNRANFTTQPEIYIQDASGNVVTNSTASVLVEIDSGTITGTATVAASSGVATFVGIGKTGLVGNKTLTFRSTGLTPVTQGFL
jgi:hypothetical protein